MQAYQEYGKTLIGLCFRFIHPEHWREDLHGLIKITGFGHDKIQITSMMSGRETELALWYRDQIILEENQPEYIRHQVRNQMEKLFKIK
jgi:hypothetical protein